MLFYSIELKTCEPNPCKHGGICKVQNQLSFFCNCEGTGYVGNKCQTGLISTPVFPKLPIKTQSRTLSVSARPMNKLDVMLHSENGVLFYPSSSLEITSLIPKQKFSVEVDKTGIQRVSFSLGGASKDDFEIPEQRVVFVEPRVLLNESVYLKLLVPKRELPVGCNEQVYKVASCELRFLSTARWTGTSPFTNGIVHVRTPSNQSIPLSMIGVNLNILEISKKRMIEKAIELTSSEKAFEVFYTNGETCIRKELRTNNLLELMRDDALVSSFLRTLSKMSPQWLNVAISGLNDLFDVHNIIANLAQLSTHEVEHCSGFPLSPSSSIAYLRPAVKYDIRVGQDETSLFDEGKTCFAIDVCKQSVFISFSRQSAKKLKEKLSVVRDMKDKGVDVRLDSVGLLGIPETNKKAAGALWNGTHFEQASSFKYNMWLKGDITWNMKIPGKLDVTLHIEGESFLYRNKMEDVSIIAYIFLLFK